ncbi:MAG: hypothetical protein ABSB76_16840 [Streptosporangiaceae bacterium]
MTGTLRLAVAQTVVPEDPTDPGTLRESGAQIRSLMRDASAAGAQLVQFPEGAISYPGKRVMSRAPDQVAASDWSRVNPDIDVALRLACPWRRTARAGLYEKRIVRGDPRSDVRTAF